MSRVSSLSAISVRGYVGDAIRPAWVATHQAVLNVKANVSATNVLASVTAPRFYDHHLQAILKSTYVTWIGCQDVLSKGLM